MSASRIAIAAVIAVAAGVCAWLYFKKPDLLQLDTAQGEFDRLIDKLAGLRGNQLSYDWMTYRYFRYKILSISHDKDRVNVVIAFKRGYESVFKLNNKVFETGANGRMLEFYVMLNKK